MDDVLKKYLESKKSYKPMKLNLQFFADDSGSEGANSDSDDDLTNDDDGNSKGETIKLTADELARKIESESDKKLNKVLEKKMKEWEAEYSEKLENAKKEGERLAKLSARERQEEELKKMEESLKNREKELLQKELRAQTISELHTKKLPPQFADFLMSESAEKTLENINSFKSFLDETVQEMVEQRLKGKSPNTGTGSNSGENSSSGVQKQEKFMELMTKHRIVGK